MNNDSEKIIKKLSLKRKASLFSGFNFWYTKSIPEYNIPSLLFSDGPHGLRKEVGNGNDISLSKTVKATCFPLACLTSCSFDVELLERLGQALADECRSEYVNVLLGPGINHKRSPLGGRNFEYFSEDPYLSGILGASYVKGVQSRGVGACLKHFACNNQEYGRFVNDSIIDERALREIYLKPFEIVIKESKPFAVMASYNKINGQYACESKLLLTDILRNEWGYDGLVVSDWGALNDPIEALKNGCNLEMPSFDDYNSKLILKKIKDKTITEDDLNKAIKPLIELGLKLKERDHIYYNKDYLKTNLGLAYEIASKSIVLLKNSDNILPLEKSQDIVLVGDLALNPIIQGGGSSQVNANFKDNLHDELNTNFKYFKGYDDNNSDSLITECVSSLKETDIVICVLGLKDESEGVDRENLKLPDSQNKLIDEISKVNKNIIIILQTGGVVQLPWINKVKGVILTYLGGAKCYLAVNDILFGKVNPSGKLAETWVKSQDDDVCLNSFGNDVYKTLYKESIYTGYRYYDTAKVNVLFPFGYGLSYSKFNLSNCVIKGLTVTVMVENIGDVFGAEVVQLYIGKKESSIHRPLKELKAFKKVELFPNAKALIHFELKKNDFEFYNSVIGKWDIESGIYQIYIGTSVSDINFVLEKEITISSNGAIPNFFDVPRVYYNLEDFQNISDENFKLLIKREIPVYNSTLPYTLNSLISDLDKTKMGSFIMKIMLKKLEKVYSKDSKEYKLFMSISKTLPIRGLKISGQINSYKALGLVLIANKKMLKGIRMIRK